MQCCLFTLTVFLSFFFVLLHCS